MLDEAIEYLKTLQLQVQVLFLSPSPTFHLYLALQFFRSYIHEIVSYPFMQIMSMGAGFYMSPMMLPPGMQHMHPHVASFSPMGVGMQMGLGMGYGMGMPDINGGSSRFPMMQVPQMHGTHPQVAPMSGPSALHGMGRSNPQMFGLPGQGLPIPTMPRAPMFSFPGEPVVNSSAVRPNACGTAGLMETVNSASASSLKDPMPNVSSQVVQNTNGCNSTSQRMTQVCLLTDFLRFYRNISLLV